MTDIRQHLAPILTLVQSHIECFSTTEALIDALRALLPQSYGISSGRVVNEHGQQASAHFDIILYDKTVPITLPSIDDAPYDIRNVLVVIKLARDLTDHQLQQFLQQSATIKTLQAALSPASKKPRRFSHTSIQPTKKIPLKTLLPLAIVAFHHFADAPSAHSEPLALRIDTLLKTQPESLRPDYLLIPGHQLAYTNPLCMGDTFSPETINIRSISPLPKPRSCYVCKQPFSQAHFFYRFLCLRCADKNYHKRSVSVDLNGRIALVTGGRVKIGYATALHLLRAGAHVLVTTRFPHDAASRYSREPDFAVWQSRLQIYGLDFRYLPVVEHFVAHLHKTYPYLDMLINNAAQTVRQSWDAYAPLLPLEQTPIAALPPEQQQLLLHTQQAAFQTPFSLSSVPAPPILHPYSNEIESVAAYSQIEGTQLSTKSYSRNSWTLSLDEIDLTEFLEVQVINVTTPFLLTSRLRPLLQQSPFPQRFIVNVSAIEGQFANSKQGTHVHTNMAKASLNMLTHTAAAELARCGIFLNSVDPGWISQQAPSPNERHAEKIQQLIPLDLIDAAARICDPIFTGIASGQPGVGQFYKDYQSVSW